MPTITIDDKTFEVEAGKNVIEAAKEIGVEVPHYCYHPGLRVDGNCRMCIVEMESPRGWMQTIGCNTFVRDGLKIRTNTEVIKETRKGVMEFLLVNHPIDCPICDQAGECGLQDYYMKYGKYQNRSIVDKVNKDKVVDIGPHVVLDKERCILCSRCVRFCEDVSESHELSISNRGVHSEIGVFPGAELDNKYSTNVVDICPVGALTSKDFRFKMRVWFMKTAKSVCQGCSRNCSIEMDHKDGKVYRFRPEFNPEVNDYWMCDDGRYSYKQINQDRFLFSELNGEEIEYEESIEKLFNYINTASDKKSILAIGSQNSSLEDNYMFKKFMISMGVEKIIAPSFKEEGEDDKLLIRADKNANKRSIDFLDISTEVKDLTEALNNDDLKLVIIMNNNLFGEASDDVKKLLEKVETVICLDSHYNETIKKAKLSIPISMYSEKYGSVINFAGQLQKFEQAFMTSEKEGSSAISEWELFGKLLNKMSNNKSEYNEIEDIWHELSNEYEKLSGLTFYDIPDHGINLSK